MNDRSQRQSMEMAAPRASGSMHGVAKGLLAGLPADARVEDVEYLLGDVREALSRIDSKRDLLQEQIAAASSSRGKRCARRAPAAAANAPAAPLLPEEGPAGAYYTRKGAGAVRRRLRAAAIDTKKERERLEAARGDLEEALIDAKERAALGNY